MSKSLDVEISNYYAESQEASRLTREKNRLEALLGIKGTGWLLQNFDAMWDDPIKR